MALSIDSNTPVSADANSTSATSVTTATFNTSAANELLIAFVSTDNTSSSTPTLSNPTGTNLTWTLDKIQNNTTTNENGCVAIFYALASSALSGQSVKATWINAGSGTISIVALQGANTGGVNGVNGIGASTSSNGSQATTTPSINITTTQNNSWCFAMLFDWNRAITITAGTNCTLVHNLNASANGSSYSTIRQTSTTPSSGTNVTMQWSGFTSGDNATIAAIEILAGSGVAAVTSIGYLSLLGVGI